MREHPAEVSLNRNPNMILFYRKFGYPPSVEDFVAERSRIFQLLLRRKYGIIFQEMD